MNLRRTLLETYKQRQQRHIDSVVELQAGGAAQVISSRIDAREQPPHPFNAGRVPAGIEYRTFSQRLGQRALELAAAEVTVDVIYNHQASVTATRETFERNNMLKSTVTQFVSGDVMLVFTKAESEPMPASYAIVSER